MAGTPYLVDSNVRWVKPDDRDYPLVVSAIDATLQRGAVFCYTSQNVAEFRNTCTRPLDRNGYGLAGSGYTARAEKPCWASVFAAVFFLLALREVIWRIWLHPSCAGSCKEPSRPCSTS